MQIWDGRRVCVVSHLKLGVALSDLVNVGQRAAIVRGPGLRQAELLDLLELHLYKVKHTTRSR